LQSFGLHGWRLFFNRCTDYFLVDIGGNIGAFCHGLFIIKKMGFSGIFSVV